MNDSLPCLENRLKTLATGERPQERLEKLGPAALSDTELLAMLLRSGTRGNDVLTLVTWREPDFQKLNGIGRVKALQLVTVMEMARRVVGQQTGERPLLNRADLVAAYLAPIVAGLEVEKFWVLCLNRKNRLLKRIEITSGTAANTLVHPREVFRAAIREGATAVICAHNHPSGDPAPSAADIQVTRQLREAAKIVDIILIDHVVIGRPGTDPLSKGYYSFRETGLL
jgi:DNA repair protein RadC